MILNEILHGDWNSLPKLKLFPLFEIQVQTIFAPKKETNGPSVKILLMPYNSRLETQ